MAYETQKTGTDCVPTALANYFGIPYSQAVTMLRREGWNDHGTGVSRKFYVPVIEKLLGRKAIKGSWRDVEKMDGLVRLRSRNGKSGHLSVLIDGHLFDPNGMLCTVEEYRKKFDWHVACIWG